MVTYPDFLSRPDLMIPKVDLWVPVITSSIAVLIGLGLGPGPQKGGKSPCLRRGRRVFSPAWPSPPWRKKQGRPSPDRDFARTWSQLAGGLAVTFGLAVLGQLTLSNGLGVGWGLGLYAGAGILFAWIIHTAGKLPPITKDEASLIRRHALPFILGSVSLLLLAFALPRVDDPGLTGWQNYTTLAAWLLSIGCLSAAVLLAVSWHPPPLRSIGASLRAKPWEAAFLIGLAGLALGLRLARLDQYPYPALKDEATLGVEATAIARGRLTDLFTPGWSLDPRLSTVPEAIAIGWLGNTLTAVRIAPAIIGAFSIILLYFLARALFDRLTAALAALCLLTLPPHLHFSRLGVNNIFAVFWATAVFWLVYRAIQKGRAADYLLAGLATGLSLYSYLGNRLLPAIAFGLLLFTIFTRPGYWKTCWRELLVFGAALVVTAAPLLIYYLHHTGFVLERFHSVDIFSTRWLVMEPVNSGQSIPAAFLTQLRKSTLVFISEAASGGWFYSPRPYLPILGAIFFVLGLTYSLSHLRDPRHLLLQAWFWATILLGSVFLIMPPSNERIVGALPAAAIFTALGLSQLAGIAKKMHLASIRLVDGLAIGLMLVISWQGASFYLGTYQQDRIFNQPAEEFELEVSQYVRTLGPSVRLFQLVALPLEAAFFPAHDFLIPEVQVEDLDEISPQVVTALPRDLAMVFVAIPQRKAELEEVAALLPGGQWREVVRQPIPGQPDEILYYSYQLPARP